MICLQTQPPDVATALHLAEIQPASVHHYRGNQWRAISFSESVPVANEHRVRFRALSIEGAPHPFPLPYCADMSRGMREYDHQRENQARELRAFALAFPDCEANQANLDSLQLCRALWMGAPPEMRERFEEAGRATEGRWARFVTEASADGDGDPFAHTPVADARRRQRSPEEDDDDEYRTPTRPEKRRRTE